MSQPVTTRNYYSPTCSLEVQVRKVPAWQRLRPPFKQRPVRFQLALDDPCYPQQEPLVIQGDRAELNALCTQVTTLSRAASAEATTSTLSLDFLATGGAVAEIVLKKGQLGDLVAALGQCAREVALDVAPELAASTIPTQSSRFALWACTAAVAIAIGGAWVARQNLSSQAEVRGDRDPPEAAEAVSAPDLIPVPPQRQIDLQLQEPTAPTFEAAPLAPPDRVGRPST